MDLLKKYKCLCGNDLWILKTSEFENTYSKKIVEYNCDTVGGEVLLICAECKNERKLVPETPVSIQIYKKMEDK